MKLKGMDIRPVPGHAFVRMESLFQNTGAIVIPGAYQSAPHVVGRIVDVAFHKDQQAHLNLEALKSGVRVIMFHASGRPVVDEDEMLKDFTLEYQLLGADGKKVTEHAVIAILGDDVDISTQTQEIERCKLCGHTKGSAQGMILWNGVCPRCHRDKYGILQPHGKEIPQVKVDDGEVAAMSESMVRPRRKSDGEYQPDGKVVSLKM